MRRSAHVAGLSILCSIAREMGHKERDKTMTDCNVNQTIN